MVNRSTEIDIAKGLLITLVVFGHVLLFTGAYPTLLKVIYSFHMFSFLCISGILWNNKKYNNSSIGYFWENKMKKILIYYFLFEAIAVFIKCLFPWGDSEKITVIITNILVGNSYLGADWYLYTYFFSCFLLFFLFRSNKPFRYFSVLIVIEAIILYFMKSIESSLMIKISRILIFTIIVFLSNTFKSQLTKDFSLTALIIIMIVFIASSLSNDTIFIHASQLGNPAKFILSGLSGVILTLNISKILHLWLLSEFGKKSLIIMGIHQNIEYLIAYFYGISNSFPYVICSFLIMLIVSCVLYIPVQFLYSSIHTLFTK